MRVWLVDTLAALVFFTLVATLSERLVAGLGWDQVLAARLTAVPAILLTGRPYGWWRDRVFVRLGAQAAGAWRRGAVDTLAFVSFQVPVYVAILLVAGATTGQIAAAAGSAVVLMLLLSRPYGLFLDACRHLAGTTGLRPT
jgi:hypothetical protein